MPTNIKIALAFFFLLSACAPATVEEVVLTQESTVPQKQTAPPSPNQKAAPTNARIEDDNEYLIRQSVPIDGILPVYNPEFLPANEAPFNDDEMIIGVAWNGEAKAYPITVLRFREIVNDELAGQPILVTFCPICFTGIVHDRRIDGEEVVFGNYGALFMSAMTWYDHNTRSIWSQPWGRAIDGILKGVELRVLSSQMTSWGNWKEQHPETLAMINDYDHFGQWKVNFTDDFVVGISIAGSEKAYYFKDLESIGLVNDSLAGVPILMWAGDNMYQAYSRSVEDMELTFFFENGRLQDKETGTTWDIARGLAIEGPLSGGALLAIPSSSSYDWAWFDFFPESELYRPIEE